jgi:hypothetical protein
MDDRLGGAGSSPAVLDGVSLDQLVECFVSEAGLPELFAGESVSDTMAANFSCCIERDATASEFTLPRRAPGAPKVVLLRNDKRYRSMVVHKAT